ncbi:hypothetical protein [Parasitella parasitica]|uniref:Uncharacterized protein n=1 Tax=Parasitella parasitica TaxID=35722 RepID=A0A0B7N0Z4_9FUNG|nr:hypothetical protein [Parasitella parasitica]
MGTNSTVPVSYSSLYYFVSTFFQLSSLTSPNFKIPRISNKHLAPNVRVSITPLYLRRSGAIEALNGIIDPNTPGLCFYGTTGNEVVGSGNRKRFEVRLDALPDRTFVFDGGCLKFRGERARQTAARVEETPAAVQQSNEGSDREDPDLLEDAVEEEMEEEHECCARKG